MNLTKAQKVEAIRALTKVKEEIEECRKRSLLNHIFLCTIVSNVTSNMKVIEWFLKMKPTVDNKLTSKFTKHPSFVGSFCWWTNINYTTIDECNEQRALFIDCLLNHLIGKSNG